MQRHLVVFGGTGFVGRQICKQAVLRGWKVTSLSRKGTPPGNSFSDWMQKVHWEKGNALDEHAILPKLLSTATDIVHSIGILTENPKKGLTYQRIICDSALNIAEYASTNCKKLVNFAFISACPNAIPRGTMRGYLQAKQQAETKLAQFPFTQIYRPPFMYGSEKKISFVLAIPVWICSWIAKRMGNPWHILPSSPPINVEFFAKRLIEGLEGANQARN